MPRKPPGTRGSSPRRGGGEASEWSDPLAAFHPAVGVWFRSVFPGPTEAQTQGWPPIVAGESTLLLAPTGSGKTLAAFLAGIDRLIFAPEPPAKRRCRLLYVSPLKALAVDVEKNLRVPIAGIVAAAEGSGAEHRVPTLFIRSGDTPAAERGRMARRPPDILITTPESLFLILTSSAREVLASVETVIVDEIHSLVATKRGAHLFVSLERLEELRRRGDPTVRPLQRIGLSATQRPLEEVARLLGGGERVEQGRETAGAEAGPGLEGPAVSSDEMALDLRPGQARAVDFGHRVDEIPGWQGRPVTRVDAGRRKPLTLTVEVPVEDMARISAGDGASSGPGTEGIKGKSLWPSIYPRLVGHIRAHRSTMVFTNSRRLAERLAAALNETAGEELALAHHGSIAREQRLAIENRLKRGELRAIVATSSLELGIDMGAVDLVVQIEAPPSVASGLQRIGRAGHSVGATSRGVIIPKYRGDLLACAVAALLMQEGRVEETFYPRNPLDVLAQQLVAVVAMDGMGVDALFQLVRRAAPFAGLPRSSFDGVLDMLSGRYPSDEFAELRPRLAWDRVAGVVRGREGARRLAVVNGGTIPDRGLYGVFLASGVGGPRSGGEDAERGPRETEGHAGSGASARSGRRSCRVGELDEEMVFESRVGDVFRLGASSWRIEDITHDRVLVSPAPGEPARMPFWHGDRPGRPAEFGRAIGEFARRLVATPRAEAMQLLEHTHGLDPQAASNLLAYLRDQAAATGEVPSDRTIVVERFLDELGDWRVCVLSPFGARIHAPWAMAVLARWKQRSDAQLDTLWSDDGLVFRLPQSDRAPDASLFLPEADEVEERVVCSLGETSLFAARFRENAARALLLPRRAPGRRAPLWAQRRRAADLLAVASAYGSFPMILETYRECLRDVFDLPGLVGLLRQVADRRIRVVTVDSRVPSPFASALLFSYVGNYMYDGDAPLAERRAAVLALDHAQLQELLGEADLRELIDADALEALEKSLQHLDGTRPIRSPDDLHDLLLAVGDLSGDEIARRSVTACETEAQPGVGVRSWTAQLQREGRVLAVRVAGEERYAAAEDGVRYRDALGVVLPGGLPAPLLEPVADATRDLVSRYARTHGPFHTEAVAQRFGTTADAVRAALARLARHHRVVEGEFRPGGRGREWCEVEVLRMLKRRSVARLRREAEPVEPAVLGCFELDWQGITRPRVGADALLAVIGQLQGAALPVSDLEQFILPVRVADYGSADLDALCAAGEVVWRGIEALGTHDGRIAFYLADQYPLLSPPSSEAPGALAAKLRRVLATRGAVFFGELLRETGGFSLDVLAALWSMVWAGEVTNDTLVPLRALNAQRDTSRGSSRVRQMPTRRAGPPGSEGRWSLLPVNPLGAGARASTPAAGEGERRSAADEDVRAPTGGVAEQGTAPGSPAGLPSGPSRRLTETERRTAMALQLLQRHGVLTREAVQGESVAGGFSSVYEVLKAMEERGRVRRGYFVAGLGATQFALPGADERLRALRRAPEVEVEAVVLAATDPANPYGAALAWPSSAGTGSPNGAGSGDGPSASAGCARPQRAAGAQVVLYGGALVAWVPRTERNLLTFLPEAEPERGRAGRAIARVLAGLVDSGQRRAVLVSQVDGQPVAKTELSRYLVEAGFTAGSRGYLKRRGVEP